MAALKTVLFTLLVPGSVTVLVPCLLLASGGKLLAWNLGPARFLGPPLVLLGAGIYLWCAWDFTVRGKGTPSPTAPPQALVMSGLYCVTRNPMYVGVALVLLGEGLWFDSTLLLAYAVVVLSAFHLHVVRCEEPVLARQFGERYARYCDTVPRWFPTRR